MEVELTAEEIKHLQTRKVLKYKCDSSLLFSTRYFYKKKHRRKFIVNWHHERIAEALERVLRGECKRLIINMPPRYGKTELAVKHFIAHALGLNPAAKFIHLSYSKSLALDNSEEIRDLVQEDFFQELYPDVKIKKDSQSKQKWYTTVGGGVYAAAAAGQVTGFGAGKVDTMDEEEEADSENEIWDNFDEFLSTIENGSIDLKTLFGGAIVIDDPIKPQEADSPVIRGRINERFDSTIRNRVNSRNTPIIIIMQRLHEDDLSGHLTKVEGILGIDPGGKWEVLSLPALSVNTDGKMEAMWPLKHTVEELKDLEEVDEIIFSRQYMQEPTPKAGLLFPKADLQWYDPKEVDLEKLAVFRFGYNDPADTGGDDLSFPVGYLVGNKIYVPDVIYNTYGTDVNIPRSVDHIINHKLNACEFEGISAWRLFAKAVRAAVENPPPLGRGYNSCEMRIIKHTTNKHALILAAAAFIRNHFVFRKDYEKKSEYGKFIENLTSYMRIQEGISKNAHDDAPDSMAGMARYFQRNFPNLFAMLVSDKPISE
jgi:predicted phage terminase large subunit-like protein